MRKTLMAITVLIALSSAARQDVPSVTAEVVKPGVVRITDSVHMIPDAGGNIAVSAGEDGIVLVDDRFAPLTPKVEEAVRTISGKPIKFVIKTNGHGDPVGLKRIARRKGTIVAHENVRRRLQSATKLPGGQTPPALGGISMVTYTDHATIHMNGEDILLYHFPSGHTGGDTIVQFTKSNVVHMGDDFILFSFPPVDRVNGGSVKGLIAALDAILARTNKDTMFIPGHGNGLGEWEVLASYRDALKGTVAILNEAIQAGKTLAEVKKEKTLVAWEHLSSDSLTLDMYAEGLYHELVGTTAKAD